MLANDSLMTNLGMGGMTHNYPILGLMTDSINIVLSLDCHWTDCHLTVINLYVTYIQPDT